MIVRAAPPEHFAWIEGRTGCVLTRNATAIEAVDDTGKVRGMVAYDGWTVNAVQAHMAVDSPIVWRSLAGPAFSYPFEECDKRFILATIAGDNEKSLALAVHFGFRTLRVLRDGWADGVHLYLLRMRRENCRFISQKRKAA